MTQIYSKFCAKIATAALIIAGAGLIAMTLLVAWVVFGRYVLNDTPVYGEPASLFLMLWFILLGGAVGVRELDHMGFDVGLHYLKGRFKSALVVVNETLVLLFGCAMCYFGFLLAQKVWGDRLPLIGISKGWDYVPIIVGGALVVLFSLEKLLLFKAGLEREPLLIQHGGEG